MNIRYALCLPLLVLSLLPAIAADLQQSAPTDAPQATISNGVVKATLYLPDAERGYYRGARFDWSGVIADLQFNGHTYFGKWFDRYDPHLHDAIMGPVEEFRSDEGAAGYAAAKPGGTFLKIGVGVLKKIDDQPYAFVKPYEIVDGGKWKTKTGKASVVFTQTIATSDGYAYEYRKTVRLAKAKPLLILEHSLRNKGKLPLDTFVYNHDFFMRDQQPTGRDFTVQFGFAPTATDDWKGLAKVDGKQIVYLKDLAAHQTAASYLTGYGASASDYDITVKNNKTGAAVHQTGDHPLARVYLWSIPTTVCPEAYIALKVAPGATEHWTTQYEFSGPTTK